jgi:hypothetical protein
MDIQTHAEFMEANPGLRLPEWAIKKVSLTLYKKN